MESGTINITKDKHDDPEWGFYPYYKKKMQVIRSVLCKYPKNTFLLDVGCGRGDLLNEYHAKGFHVLGLDKNYTGDLILNQDALTVCFTSKTYDIITCLDLLEHLYFNEQKQLINRMSMWIKPNGCLIVSVPNLAHLVSRIRFLRRGVLDSNNLAHVGDRPINQYLTLFKKAGFIVEKRIGYTYFMRWKILAPFIKLFPDLCVQNFIIFRRLDHGN